MMSNEPTGADDISAGIAKSNVVKIQRLREAGIEPYPYEFVPTHAIADLHTELPQLLDNGSVVAIASRVVAHRSSGKELVFFDLAATAEQVRQGTKIQVMCRSDQIGSASRLVVESLSLGDWIGVRGTCMRTRTGEPTVRADEVVALSKVLRPVPFPKIQLRGGTDPAEHYRIQNVEALWRYPELDMLTGRKADVLVARSRVLKRLREVLADDFGCVEVETPYLNPYFGGAEARPFKTTVAAFDQEVFLAVSPEIELKRAVVGGLGSGGSLGRGVYSIARNFRNEGVDRTHNPEFTSLEVYIPFVDYSFMMRVTEVLFREACLAVHGESRCSYGGRILDFSREWVRVPMVELVTTNSGIDVGAWNEEQIRSAIRSRGLQARIGTNVTSSRSRSRKELLGLVTSAGIAQFYPGIEDASASELRGIVERHRLAIGIDTSREWDHMVLDLFEVFCEPFLWAPCHITLHPAKSTVLCKRFRGGQLPNGQRLIERFESFGAAMELSNAYSELNDPVLQRTLIEHQALERESGNEEAMPHNEKFLRSIEMGLPPCGGLGIGIDRMIMLLTNSHSIREVIAFPMTAAGTAKD